MSYNTLGKALTQALERLTSGMRLCTYRRIGKRYLIRLADGTYTSAVSVAEAQEKTCKREGLKC